jgi:DNA-directed RNA polymerase subunit RPC12/RpoP
MKKNENKTIRCVICGSEFGDRETENASCCPSCGHKGVPMSIKDDVEIKINWHELHILCCWAERWALRIEKESPCSVATLDCIAQRLQKQYPAKCLLTIRGDLAFRLRNKV